MNLLAHGEVARRLPESNADRTLGAMLPDLTHMLGFRLEPDRLTAAVRTGWSCHVATDRWFHADERFRGAVRQMAAALAEDGWGRWTAQAVAHASWELLLDGQLARSSDPSSWYLEALTSESFRACLAADERSTWDQLVDAQIRQPLWKSYLTTEGIADRTWRRVRSTRLAFPEQLIPELVAVLDPQSDVIAEVSDALMTSAVDAVSP